MKMIALLALGLVGCAQPYQGPDLSKFGGIKLLQLDCRPEQTFGVVTATFMASQAIEGATAFAYIDGTMVDAPLLPISLKEGTVATAKLISPSGAHPASCDIVTVQDSQGRPLLMPE